MLLYASFVMDSHHEVSAISSSDLSHLFSGLQYESSVSSLINLYIVIFTLMRLYCFILTAIIPRMGYQNVIIH